MTLKFSHTFAILLCGATILTAFAFFANPGELLAQSNSASNAGGSASNSGGSVTNPSSGSGQLTNPLKSASIEEFILKVIDVILIFALPIIVLYIMYAGFLFVTAKGDTGQISTAKNALLYSVIGGVIVLGAKVIVTVIEGTIKGF